MEESSNGKIQKVETEEENGEVVINDVQELKPVEDISVREVVIDGNFESVKESNPGGDDYLNDTIEENISQEVEEEKVQVINSVVESREYVLQFQEVSTVSVEASDEKLKDSDVPEVETEEFIEKSFVSSDVTETESKPQSSDETDGGVSAAVSIVAEEIMLPVSDEKDVSKGIEDENIGVSSALTELVSRGIEETEFAPSEKPSDIVDEESEENADDSAKPAASTYVVGSNDGFPETTGNPSIISLSQRTVQPKYWRSCCGLFDVLKRSNT